MIQLGDYNTGATIDFKFSTVSQTNTPITLAGSPAVAVYKANGTTETTTGVTLTVDFDSRTGLHNVRIVTSDSFYATGEDFDVVLTAGTVDSVSVAGRVLAHFTINKASADVRRVSGTAVPAGTGFPLVDASYRVDIGSLMGTAFTVSANVVTFPAGLKLAPSTTLKHALELAGAAGGSGLRVIGGARDGVSDSVKDAIWVSTGGDAYGLAIFGGTGIPAVYLEKGTGSTYDAILGDVSGVLTNVTLTATTTTASNLTTNNDKTGYSLTAGTGLGNQTANITGNLSGSVGSVSGAVGSVTGAVGSVTGNVGGNVTGSVGSISGVTFPTNFSTLGINASGHISRVTLVDQVTITDETSLISDYGTLSADTANALLDMASGIETNITPRGAFRLILAASAGKLSGAATTTVAIRNVGDTKTRLSATVDSDGNRTAVTTDAT